MIGILHFSEKLKSCRNQGSSTTALLASFKLQLLSLVLTDLDYYNTLTAGIRCDIFLIFRLLTKLL